VLPAPATRGPDSTPPALTPAPTQAEQPPAAPADAQLTAVLQPLLEEWLAEGDIPGATLGVRLADGRTAVVAAGSTDDVGGQPVQPGHRFRIGSITKTFVAMLVLQLVEDGLVELDDQLATYLPEAPFAGQVTVRQLLSHTSGVPDFGVESQYAQLMIVQPARRWSSAEVLALVADLPLDFEPGTSTSYSNTNYTLAGMLVEEVGDGTLAELLRERILEPAGLEATYLEELEPAPAMAVSGHFDIDGDGEPDNVRHISYTALVTSGAAAGGMSANAADMLEFSAALAGGQLVSEETLSEALGAAEGGYGLGLVTTTRDDRQVWGHGGALPGFSAAFGHLPEEGVSVAALSNQTGANVNELMERALVALLGEQVP
jgi:D-alanyl-D-alanine carboxypeptidase